MGARPTTPQMTGINGGPSLSEPAAVDALPPSEATEIDPNNKANEEYHVFSHRDSSRNGQDLRPWLPDFVFCTFGTVFCTVVIILAHKAGGRQPPGIDPIGRIEISFTALLALFSELTKMALAPAIASSLVQLSLVRFVTRSQPLTRHLDYETAARGPWGSVKLLFKPARGISWFARLAALCVLTFLLTGPLTQLALGVDTVLVRTGEPNAASVPVSRMISRWNGTHYVTAPFDRTAVLQAIRTGASPQNDTVPYVQPKCLTGDCDFPVVSSLAICSATSNLTEQARNSPRIQGVVMAQMDSIFKRMGDAGPPVIGDPPLFMLAVAANDQPTGAFEQAIVDTTSVDLILAFSNEPILLSGGVPKDFSNVQFVEIAFHFCTVAYEARVRNGTATTVELSRGAKILSPSPGNASTTLNILTNPRFMDCYNPTLPKCQGYGDEVPDGAATKGQLWIDLWTALTLSFTLQLSLTGGILQTGELTEFVRGGDASLALSTGLLGDEPGLRPYAPDVQLRNIERTASNIARALSNTMRLLAPAAGQAPVVVEGTAYRLRAVYTVRLHWLALIVCQNIAAWLIFLRAVWLSRRCRLEAIREEPLAKEHILMRSDDVLPRRLSHGQKVADIAGDTVVRLYRDRVDGFLKFCVAECANMGCHENVVDDLEKGAGNGKETQQLPTRLRKRPKQ
ncbi:hypothetical protein QBC34DRAFT_443290 [Podospora aff. communis PSN243]|uniref:Uncharacterized protein n=1 Tax=Podospora aff. communis PSN243 TaxID=3040156 RepID=A0AAV9G7L2_9PEZI|nr:hypothetical protein QBC34DRAFT_443290 [Podospora aff. communis PSN243]